MKKFAIEHHEESGRHILWSFYNGNKYRIGSWETVKEAHAKMEECIERNQEKEPSNKYVPLRTGLASLALPFQQAHYQCPYLSFQHDVLWAHDHAYIWSCPEGNA